MKWLALLLSLLIPEANAQLNCRIGGLCNNPPNAGGCSPFSYAASPVYQSLAFTDSWNTDGATLTTNAVKSPACTTTGAIVTDNAVNGSHLISQTAVVSVTSGTTYIYKIFAKRAAGSTLNFAFNIFDTTFESNAQGYYDLSNCTVHAGGFAATNFSNFAQSTSAIASPGWCQLTMTFKSNANYAGFAILLEEMDAAFNDTYAGTGTALNMWGLDVR